MIVPPQKLGHGVVLGVGRQVFKLIECCLIKPGHQYTGAAIHHGCHDVRDLPGSFAGAKNYFR